MLVELLIVVGTINSYFHGSAEDISQKMSANVLCIDGHVDQVRQPIDPVKRTTSTFSVSFWHKEFASLTAKVHDRNQQLVWDYTRPG